MDRSGSSVGRGRRDVTRWRPGLFRSGCGDPDLYIVLVTALGSRDEIVEGMEAGADDYLVKPLDLLDLRLRLIAAADTPPPSVATPTGC